jgi:hypothetical protein
MKYLIAVIVLIAIIGGAAYFLTKKPVTEPAGPAPVGTTTEQTSLMSTTTNGVMFSYPELTTTYVSAAEWPPKVEQLDDFSCAPTDNGPTGKVEKRTINGKVYCVTIESEGAAGSTYVTYGYTTDRGDAVLRATFTLRFPQCLNYDDPNQTSCKNEQASFNVDTLAAGILGSASVK